MNLSDSFTASLPDNSGEPSARAEAAQDAETELPLSRISRRSAADEVREQLLAMIGSGILKVNGRLPSEAELGQRFGVSRPVIREALRGLQVLGLTESRTGRGTFVASRVAKLTLSFGQYSPADLSEVRRCIEVPSASLAARRSTQADIEEMRRILDAHEQQVTDTREAVRLDAQFHCTIARATGNMLFLRIIEDLREILQEQSLAVSALPDRHERAASEHRAVFDAIARGDAGGAAAAMARHLGAVENAVSELTSESDETSQGGDADDES